MEVKNSVERAKRRIRAPNGIRARHIGDFEIYAQLGHVWGCLKQLTPQYSIGMPSHQCFCRAHVSLLRFCSLRTPDSRLFTPMRCDPQDAEKTLGHKLQLQRRWHWDIRRVQLKCVYTQGGSDWDIEDKPQQTASTTINYRFTILKSSWGTIEERHQRLPTRRKRMQTDVA